jgi:hypothetical protein
MPTMSLSFLQFPQGTPVPNTLSALIPVPAGESVTLTAPATLLEPAGTFLFGFWNKPMGPSNDTTVMFPAPPDGSDFSATAWYFEQGNQPSLEIVSVAAFSLDTNKVLTGKNPIASVTPAGLWAGPSSPTVSTNFSPTPSQPAVVITAEPVIGGFGRFAEWLEFSEGTAAAATLSVPAHSQDQAAIAFYSIPVPDPCAEIRGQLRTISPADFPNIQDFERVVRALEQQLLACESQFGEI